MVVGTPILGIPPDIASTLLEHEQRVESLQHYTEVLVKVYKQFSRAVGRTLEAQRALPCGIL